MGVGTQNAVDEVDDVCSHHGDFIDNDEFQSLQEFYVVLAVFQELAYATACIA